MKITEIILERLSAWEDPSSSNSDPHNRKDSDTPAGVRDMRNDDSNSIGKWQPGAPKKKVHPAAPIRYIDPEITKILLSKGYKPAGKGTDQIAFHAPDGSILKIFKTNPHNASSKFSRAQLMIMQWIKYCEEHADNPFLPKFSGWESFEFPENSGNMYLQISMEKLGKFPYSWNEELAGIADYIEHRPDWRNEEGFNKWLNNVANMNWAGDENRQTLAVHLGEDNLRLLWNTLIELFYSAKNESWVFDLHDGNFMIRNDGFPVILDPWFTGHYKN